MKTDPSLPMSAFPSGHHPGGISSAGSVRDPVDGRLGWLPRS
jgi:hypothetical protein